MKKSFDCLQMKRDSQRMLRDEFQTRQDEFATYADFLRAKADESEWIRNRKAALGIARPSR